MPSSPTVASAEQMHRLEEVAIQEMGLPLFAMMENAGRLLARVALEVGEGPYAVLVGKGNNGGGGLVAARHLVNLGAEVTLVPLVPQDELAPATAAEARVLLAMGVTTAPTLPPAGVVLDALVGTGLRGAPQAALAAAIEALEAHDALVVSLDLPSGLDPDTGKTPGAAVTADATLTLGAPKAGLVSGEGPRLAGTLLVGDLGVPAAAYEAAGLQRPPFGPDGILELDL